MNEKVLKVIEAAKSRLGNPYVFGMWGRQCTPSVRRQYAGYNPSHKNAIYKACPVLSGKQPSCDGCKWQGKLAFDCRGFTYWCLLQAGIKIKGSGATAQYNTAANWAQRGDISDMPDVVCCVFQRRNGKMQHTGLHIGGGKVIHCSAGVQWGDTSDKAWTYYAIPAGLYTADEIAAAIDRVRQDHPIETTLELVDIIRGAMPAKALREKQHPAKRSFQAIRIAVNDELGAVRQGMEAAIDHLKPGGRLAVITFHSLEDRIVKNVFQDAAKGCTCPPSFPVCVCGHKPKIKILTKKPIIATREEVEENPRSRSAKLRVAERV